MNRLQTERLRWELRHGSGADLKRRRAIIGASLLGMASMAAAMLYQTGIVKHLPDPPIPSFDSDRVNASHEAYRLGVPDGPMALVAFAANLPLAAAGGLNRATDHPWLPLAAGAKAVIDAIGAGYYFSLMPVKEKAWCGYCIVATAADLAVLALALPEARKALRQLAG